MARHVHIIVAIAAACVSDQLFFFPKPGGSQRPRAKANAAKFARICCVSWLPSF